MAQADPAKATEQPYKAVVENDRARLASLLDHAPDLVKGVGEAYEGITVEAFEQLLGVLLRRRCGPGAAGRPWLTARNLGLFGR